MTAFRARWMYGIVVLVLLLACGGSQATSASNGTCHQAARPSDTPPRIIAALVDLDAFWCAEFAREGRSYTPISAFRAYHDSPRHVACGVRLGSRNAFYCAADGSIYYNVDWFTDGVSPVDAGGLDEAVVVLAHEYGHHVQQLLGTGGWLSAQRELQADCYAGVYLNAVDRGSPRVHLTRPALKSVLTLFVLGDGSYYDMNWFAGGAHGDALSRRYAWARGYTSGQAARCAPYGRYGYQQPVAFGDDLLVVPPGATVLHDASGRPMAFDVDQTTVLIGDVSPLRGRAIDRFDAAAANNAASRWKGWSISWAEPARGFVEGSASLAVRDYTATQRSTGAPPLVRHGTMLLGIGQDGVAFILDGSKPGAPTDASLDDIDTVLLTTANGASALFF